MSVVTVRIVIVTDTGDRVGIFPGDDGAIARAVLRHVNAEEADLLGRSWGPFTARWTDPDVIVVSTAAGEPYDRFDVFAVTGVA